MNARWGDQTRIEAAKELISKTVDDLATSPNLEIGLRVYGHQSPITATFQDCNDTKLEVPFAQNNFSRSKHALNLFKQKGQHQLLDLLKLQQGISQIILHETLSS